MIVAQDAQGLVFWPEDEISSMVPEFRNWWRIVHHTGAVAHRPTSPPAVGFSPLGEGLVNPRWMRRGPGGEWLDSANFIFPAGELAQPPRRPPQKKVRELPCPPEEIYAVVNSGRPKEFVWLTDGGMLPAKGTAFREVIRPHPSMVGVQPKKLWINYDRLRRLVTRDKKFTTLIMDNGIEFQVVRGYAPMLKALNLESTEQLYPTLMGRFGNYQLRDWPFEIRLAPSHILEEHFADARMLTGHLIWQRFRYISQGVERIWADGYGGLWYEAMAHTHCRAGFLKVEDMSGSLEESRSAINRRGGNQDVLYKLMWDVLDSFVDECEFFTMREFGFKDPCPQLTTIGAVLPQVVLITEKDEFYEFALKLVAEFGVSHYHLQGQPSLIRSEYAAERLKAFGPLRGIAYTDYDVGGWTIGNAAAKHLTRYGAPMPRLDFLVRAHNFSPAEISLYSKPCPSSTKMLRTKAANWVEESGGIEGHARGIHANHIDTYERVREMFLRLLKS